MQRAIVFSRTIEDSKRLSTQFENVVNEYLNSDEGYSVNVRHVDGSMNALEKNEALYQLPEGNWIKQCKWQELKNIK